MKGFPIEVAYGIIAVAGGIARYLNGVITGSPFNAGILAASAFVSGFSGYMFALAGISMGMPEPVLFMMAGVGGFFGDQTMKLIMDYIAGRIPPKPPIIPPAAPVA